MPRVSLILPSVNNRAMFWARKFSELEVEHGKGFDFIGDRITRESDIVVGGDSKLYYNFTTLPKDIFVHNHPGPMSPLSFEDVNVAVNSRVQKMIVTHKHGFTSMDFTTADELILRAYLPNWFKDVCERNENLLRQLTSENRKSKINPITLLVENYYKLYDSSVRDLTEFANYTGALFENVNWRVKGFK